MENEKALTAQDVADILHISKSTVYELIHRGEINSYKIGRKVRFTAEDVNAYIARSRHEFSTKPVKSVAVSSSLLKGSDSSSPDIVISGQDVVLDILANHLPMRGIRAGRAYLPSFEGLLAMYEGKVGAASCHLYSAEYNEFNVPYVKAMVPGVRCALINISYRWQGFYVKKGNPKHITQWEDLAREDISVFNRRIGSSSRILLDVQLKKRGIDPQSVSGYDRDMQSHLTMAAAIAEGGADVGVGTQRVSKQIDGIDFIPLIEERYDLVIKKQDLEGKTGQIILDILSDKTFRKEISYFSGNDYRDIGKIIAEV